MLLLCIIQVRIYEKPGTNICVAFITNNHTNQAATVNFRGSNYFMPPHSISVLPDCKTVVYNTQMVTCFITYNSNSNSNQKLVLVGFND